MSTSARVKARVRWGRAEPLEPALPFLYRFRMGRPSLGPLNSRQPVPGLMRFRALYGYFTNWDILKMGSRIEDAMNATIPPIRMIISGSMAAVTDLIVAFNCRS